MENPGEKEEIPCKGQKLLLSGKGPSEPFTLYSGVPLNCISKEKLEKRSHDLKHMRKSEEILESGQLDGSKEQSERHHTTDFTG